MNERRNSITVIIGRKGCGKTTRAREEMRAASRLIILDPMLEYGADGVQCRTFAELARYVGPNRHARYRAVLQFLDDSDRDAAMSLATQGTPEAPALPDVLVVGEELNRICTPSTMTPELKRILFQGRHYTASFLGITQRPRAIHRDVTAMADKIIVGQTQEPRDLDYLAQFIGDELAARCKDLRVGEFIVWPDDETRADLTNPEEIPHNDVAPSPTGDTNGESEHG